MESHEPSRDDLEKSARPASRLGSTNAAKQPGGFLKVIPTGFSAPPACSASFPSCLWDSSITPLHRSVAFLQKDDGHPTDPIPLTNKAEKARLTLKRWSRSRLN